MEPRRDEIDLAAELRALRPNPRPEFAAELDAKAAAGFPRQTDSPSSRHPGVALGRIAERLRATPPRRLLAPAGAFAVTAIVVATAVVATSEDQPTSVTFDAGRSGLTTAPEPSNDGIGASRSNEAVGGVASSKSSSGANSTGIQGSSGIEYSEAPSAALSDPRPSPGPGPYASRTGQRNIERSAQIVLGADPADVRRDAAKVFDAVHAANGIVLRSSIRDGAEGEAGAEFELLVPSGKLGDALADFSAIGEVRSRREATQDITVPTIGVREHLQDSQARIEGLLAQLAAASTEEERAAIEAELRIERRRSAFLRSRLAALNRRANLSHVSLRIETGASPATENDGAWGVSDGLDDAGRILAIAAGVTIIGLAILAPLTLIALLAWFVHHAWIRSRREQALR